MTIVISIERLLTKRAMKKRNETRAQRYEKKKQHAKTLPISLCSVNFMFNDNLGYLIRSAACFGAKDVHVIGHVPERKDLNSKSGSLYDYVKIIQHDNPSSFLDFAKSNDVQLVSAEITENSTSVFSYTFNFSRNIFLVVGQEEYGVPIDILRNSDIIHIPMNGIGYCLNTSQAANIIMYEAARQYSETHL